MFRFTFGFLLPGSLVEALSQKMPMEGKMRYAKWTAVAAAIVGLVFLSIWWESRLPSSTQGITIVAGNTARVPQGEDFVLAHNTKCGKRCTDVQIWHITYDGQRTVSFKKDGAFFGFSGSHKTAKLCGRDCEVKVHMGLWTDMFVTERRVNGVSVVDVKWPWGWNYRAYKS